MWITPTSQSYSHIKQHFKTSMGSHQVTVYIAQHFTGNREGTQRKAGNTMGAVCRFIAI